MNEKKTPIGSSKDSYLEKGYHYCRVVTFINEENGGCYNLVRDGDNGCLWHEGMETK